MRKEGRTRIRERKRQGERAKEKKRKKGGNGKDRMDGGREKNASHKE